MENFFCSDFILCWLPNQVPAPARRMIRMMRKGLYFGGSSSSPKRLFSDRGGFVLKEGFGFLLISFSRAPMPAPSLARSPLPVQSILTDTRPVEIEGC